MTTGLTDDLQAMDDTRKTAVIDRELQRLNVDIAALQETRLPDSGSLREENYTFFWQGKSAEETREYGVGFAVKNPLQRMIEPPTGGMERILTLRLSTDKGSVNFVCIYAPTLMATDETKDQFYGLLDQVIKGIPLMEQVYILGDFNARVGADHESWPDTLGHHGIGKMNENGQRLLELCCYHRLCVTNTYFKNKTCHKTSWRHPRSKHWHQLDLIITRKESLNNVHNTRAYHSADCDTDHSLIASRVKLRPKKLYHSKKKVQSKINTCMTAFADKNLKFNQQLTDALSNNVSEKADDCWNFLRDTIYSSAIETYGKKEHKNTDWFEANITEMEPVIKAKRVALIKYKDNPSQSNLQTLRSTRNKAQQVARRCANDYWAKLSDNIQAASDTGNIRKMYEGIKQATGVSIRTTAPLKSKSGETITDRAKQMSRWVEHYLELYSRQNIITQGALDSIQNLPVLDDLDSEPTKEDLSKAIKDLANGKAAGVDCIPPEIIKCGEPTLLEPLHKLLCLCWREGHLPQDMRNAKIVTLYKNKGDRSDCNNYRRISLLSTVG